MYLSVLLQKVLSRPSSSSGIDLFASVKTSDQDAIFKVQNDAIIVKLARDSNPHRLCPPTSMKVLYTNGGNHDKICPAYIMKPAISESLPEGGTVREKINALVGKNHPRHIPHKNPYMYPLSLKLPFNPKIAEIVMTVVTAKLRNHDRLGSVSFVTKDAIHVPGKEPIKAKIKTMQSSLLSIFNTSAQYVTVMGTKDITPASPNDTDIWNHNNDRRR